MIDLATLTGAIGVALGKQHAGLFSNDDELSAHLTASGLTTGERLWRLPMGPDYDRIIDSRFADMKNSGGRYGGVGTSAVFLREFTAYPWAHLDIAGMAYSSQAQLGGAKGATGFGVRLLIAYLRN